MRIKLPCGTTEENNRLLLPEGMLSIDLEKKALRIHDGVTQGGFEVLGKRAYDPFPHDVYAIPPAGTNHLNEVIYANGVYLASGGNADRIYRSVDLDNWTTHILPFVNDFNTNTSIYGITFSNGKFWACGYYGNLFSSNNGLSWTKIPSVISVRTLNGIQSLGGKLVVHASQQRLMYSNDGGINWNESIPPWSANNINTNAVTHGGGRYVAAARDGRVAHSSDLVTWALADVPTGAGEITSLAHGNGRFIGFPVGVGGKLITSIDGITWSFTDHPDPTDPNRRLKLHFLQDAFYAFAENSFNRIYRSANGLSWERIDSLDIAVRGLSYSPDLNKIMIAGSAGKIALAM